MLDSDVEVYVPVGLANSGIHHGTEGFARWVGDWAEAWSEFTNEAVRIEPVGPEHVVAELEQSAVGAGSGVKVEMSIFYLWEIRGGRVTRFHLYPDWDAAVAAARSFSDAA